MKFQIETLEKENKNLKINNSLNNQDSSFQEKKINETMKNYQKVTKLNFCSRFNKTKLQLENELLLTKKQLDQQNSRVFQLEEEKSLQQIQHNNEFDQFEQKLDFFVNEMNNLKERNERLTQNELNLQKKINQLELENDNLKIESQKLRLKFDKTENDSFSMQNNSFKLDEKITFKKAFNSNDVSHRDIKQKLQVIFYQNKANLLFLEIGGYSKNVEQS